MEKLIKGTPDWHEIINRNVEETDGQFGFVTSQLAENTQQISTLTTTKADNIALQGVSSQIANILANNGNGTKDAELADARVDADGKVELSLKSRLDKKEYVDRLLANDINGTKQSVTFDVEGKVQSLQHKNIATGSLVRVDVFAYTTGFITETRTLANGYSLIFKHNLVTLDTSILSLVPEYVKNKIVYNAETWSPWVLGLTTSVVQGLLQFTGMDSSANTHIDVAFKPSTKYGLLFNVVSNSLAQAIRMGTEPTGTLATLVLGGVTGKIKHIFTTPLTLPASRFSLNISTGNKSGIAQTKEYRIFELTPNSEIESDFTNLTVEQLHIKYPWN